jgi:hypothetical protein
MTPQPAAPQKKKMSGWSIVLIVLGVGGGCCVVGGGMLAAIAIPNFIKFQARSKQAECKTNLRALYRAERTFFDEKRVFSENAEQVGFVPETKYYAYAMSREGAPAAARDRVHGTLGINGTCPDCTFTAACVGNIDNDPEVDVWSVSTNERTGPGGQMIPAGEVFHEFDDVTDSVPR